jgi:hypothetical protein
MRKLLLFLEFHVTFLEFHVIRRVQLTVVLTLSAKSINTRRPQGTSNEEDNGGSEIWGDANTVTVHCGGSVAFSAQSNQVVTSAPCETG